MVAGLTVGAMLIPQCVAYAELAGPRRAKPSPVDMAVTAAELSRPGTVRRLLETLDAHWMGHFMDLRIGTASHPHLLRRAALHLLDAVLRKGLPLESALGLSGSQAALPMVSCRTSAWSSPTHVKPTNISAH